jgi:hypothetical protein
VSDRFAGFARLANPLPISYDAMVAWENPGVFPFT